MSRISYIEDMEKWQVGFSFSHPISVRFSETDMFGHLNNTVPFTYFELARIEYFKYLNLMQDWLNTNKETIPVVADLQCDFIRQVFFDEKIDLYVKATRIGNSSVDLHYMAKNPDGHLLFTGRGTIVQISKLTGRPVAWSEDIKQSFAASSGLPIS
ncbi:MAG: acyl-CoA thioesterase [Bacillus sp. (in: firmicutes)]